MAAVQNGVLPVVLEGLEQIAKIRMSPKAALKVRKLIRLVSEHYQDVEKVRNEIVLRGAEKDGEGNPVPGKEPDSVKLVDPDATTREIVELYTQTHDFPALTLDMLPEDAEVSPEVLLKIGDLLEEPAE